MKEREERELNGEVIPNSEESPVKSGDEVNGEERASKSDTAATEEQDDAPTSSTADGDPVGEGTANHIQQGKESQPCDTAQGALGQVKAKVEVCKDESIGKSTGLISESVHKDARFRFPTQLNKTSPQNLKTFACTWKNASTLNK